MKTHIFIYALISLISTKGGCKTEKTAIGGSGETVAIASDTVVNSSFENKAGINPEYWEKNSETNDQDASFLASVGNSGDYALIHKKGEKYKVETTQTLRNLANGIYTLTAYTQNSGGQNSCYLEAKSFGGNLKMTSVPVSTSWTKVTLRGIEVTNGKCTIGFSSDANAGNWAKFDDIELTKDDKPYTFLKGGDFSELSYIESKGGKFYENGIAKDCFEILKNNRINLARLRLYNDPGNADYSPSKRLPKGFQDPKDILRLSKRAKNAGMKILLTFHYSDYWTNPSLQDKPHEWKNLNYGDLKKTVYDFTYNFMNEMKNQGTTPEFVAIGNETANGFLFPDGDTKHFDQMAELFNQGYDAVKAVSPSTKVIIHLDAAGDSKKYDWFFGELIKAGGKFDMIGSSYYPFWTGKNVTEIKDWFNIQTAKYNKDFIIMETGYNWNSTLSNGKSGQLAHNGPYDSIYPSSPEGQKNFMLECFNGIKSVNNGRLIGDVYWDPVMITVPGVGWELGKQNVVDNTTWFDFKGNSLPILKAYKFNN